MCYRKPFFKSSHKSDDKNDDKYLSIGGLFEFLITEWHVTPDYIINNWTQELLYLMVEKLNERKKGERDAIEEAHPDTSGKVSDIELFDRMGVKVKHGN